jgi:hypothetical protein
MGYLNNEKQGQNSTKFKEVRFSASQNKHLRVEVEVEVEEDEEEELDEYLKWSVMGVQELMNSLDATGRFPITSKSGWDYILVSTMKGYVHLELLQDRTKAEYYVRAYRSMYDVFKRHGHQPTIQRLDN